MGFWDAFTGKSQRNDILAGQEQANQYIQQALGQASGTTSEYLNKALGYLQPGMETGGNALRLLGDALGANGQPAQQGYFNTIQTDPGFQAAQDYGIRALDRSAASRGLLRSGGQQEALYDFGQKNFNDFYNTRTNNLFNLAGIGTGAANTSAGLTSQAGDNLANMQFGTGQLFANNAINTQNAVAQSRSVPINNILGGINAAANLFGAFNPKPTFNFKA